MFQTFPTRRKITGRLVLIVALFSALAAPAILIAARTSTFTRWTSWRSQTQLDAPYPWEFEPTNDRERDHLEAADFLANLNFYEDGHGLVLPPSLTAERIESLFGKEEFAKLGGLVYDEGRVYGVREEKLGSIKLLVSGCGACHVGKAAGRVIPGLGNKNADFFGLVEAAKDMVNSAIAVDATINKYDEQWQRANKAGSEAFLSVVNHPEYDPGVSGAVTQFFALEMAFEKLGLAPLKQPLYAPVKTPSFWGYGPKREVGVFTDALLKGAPAGAAGLPLFIGNYNLDVFQQNMETYEQAEQHFEKLLPPKYPFDIDQSVVARGKGVYSDRCLECHGEHNRDGDGLPLFTRPNFIELAEVNTDPVRATVFDEEATQRFSETPLAPYLQQTGNEPGYIAPNLWGIWSRFPYLHNGSVANIADLLTEPSERPEYIDLFEIGEEHRFDQRRLGAAKTNHKDAHKRASYGDRLVLDTNRKGFSNSGHDFGTDLDETDKQALIEYLKTL